MIKLTNIPEGIDDTQRSFIEESNRVKTTLKELVKSLLENGNDAEDIAELCWHCGFEYATDYYIKEDMLKPKPNQDTDSNQ